MSTSVPPPNLPEPVAARPLPAPAPRARVRLLASIALAAVVAAIAFVALGGSGSRIVDPVAEAATVSSGTPGYRMRFSLEVGSPVIGTVTGAGSGVFDLRDRTGSVSLTMNLGNDPQVIQTLGSNTLALQEIVSGTTVYMKLPAALTGALPISGTPWIAVDLAKLSGIPGLSSLTGNPVSSDPAQMLQYLRAVSDSVLAEGHRVIDGLGTTHYRAEIDLDRVAGDLPARDQAAARQALASIEQATGMREMPVDVWIDAHHLVRRIQTALDMSTPGGQAVQEAMTIDISHYGPQPQPAVPPSDQVTDLSSLIGSGG